MTSNLHIQNSTTNRLPFDADDFDALSCMKAMLKTIAKLNEQASQRRAANAWAECGEPLQQEKDAQSLDLTRFLKPDLYGVGKASRSEELPEVTAELLSQIYSVKNLAAAPGSPIQLDSDFTSLSPKMQAVFAARDAEELAGERTESVGGVQPEEVRRHRSYTEPAGVQAANRHT